MEINKGGYMVKTVSETRLRAQTTLNNIKGYNYSVADYKLCERESKIIITALEKYINEIKFDEEVEVI